MYILEWPVYFNQNAISYMGTSDVDPVEVVDMEVKITSMQGTHIFQRDRTTQLIKCTPWSTRLHSHPTIVKKMRTFLEVEGKMGLIPQPTSSQYRPPQSGHKL